MAGRKTTSAADRRLRHRPSGAVITSTLISALLIPLDFDLHCKTDDRCDDDARDINHPVPFAGESMVLMCHHEAVDMTVE